jgi:hypothetical protein
MIQFQFFRGTRNLLSLGLGLFLFGSLAHGQATPVRPTLPKIGVDDKLLGGLSPREFFAARKVLGPCQQELSTLRASYLEARATLEKMSGGGDLTGLDAQEETMEAARDLWVEKLAECGNCARRDLEIIKVPKLPAEYWYVADGSCQVDTADAAELEASFLAKANSLVTQDAYRHNKGGFPTVLSFQAIDSKTGLKIETPTLPMGVPFFAFISVRGPVFLGFQASFGYVYKNEGNFVETNGTKEYVHTFTSYKAPRGFQYPATVAQHLASGRKRNANLLKLNNVQGFWYLTQDGYLRYHTAADLGMDFDYARHLAQKILITTLSTLYERGVGEAP